jgi:hypothetical protein
MGLAPSANIILIIIRIKKGGCLLACAACAACLFACLLACLLAQARKGHKKNIKEEILILYDYNAL